MMRDAIDAFGLTEWDIESTGGPKLLSGLRILPLARMTDAFLGSDVSHRRSVPIYVQNSKEKV